MLLPNKRVNQFKCTLLLGMALTGLASGTALADIQHDTITGQFLTVHNGPRIEQQQLMQQTFEVHFPMDVLSVGDAIQYLLQTTGYRLVTAGYPLVADLMRRPLPDIDRDFGPMTIQQGLQALVGEQFQLLIDPVHREIAFRIKPGLRTIYPAA